MIIKNNLYINCRSINYKYIIFNPIHLFLSGSDSEYRKTKILGEFKTKKRYYELKENFYDRIKYYVE